MPEPFKHLERDHDRDILRQRAQQRHARLLRRPAPVVRPEHDIRLRAVPPDDLFQQSDILRIVAARPPAGAWPFVREFRLRLCSRNRAYPSRRMRVSAWKFDRFADKDQALCLRIAGEDLPVDVFVVFLRARVVRVHFGGDIAVKIDAEAILRRAVDDILNIPVTARRFVDASERQHNGIKSVMRHKAQLRVRELIHSPPGMHHSGRKCRCAHGILPLQNRCLLQIHQILQIIASLCRGQRRRAGDPDPAFRAA